MGSRESDGTPADAKSSTYPKWQGEKRKRKHGPTTPEGDRWPHEFDKGGQWYHFPNTDCARGLNASELAYQSADPEKAVLEAKDQCMKEGWAGFSDAKKWNTFYFKYAAHRLQPDWKYTCPDKPAESVDTHVFLTTEEYHIWEARAKEFQTWKNDEKNKDLAYEDFEDGASWECDFRKKPEYQRADGK